MTVTNPPSETQVSFDHRRIDLEAYDSVYVVGDVHGCLDALETLLSTLDLGENDLAIFVGDLVRKGPESEAVVDRIRASPQLMSVRGNNEQKLIDGTATLEEFGPSAQAYIESLPVAISWDGGLVVHGGIEPSRPFTAHSSEELLTMRAPDGDGYDGPFWFDEYDGNPRVFFGHTVLEQPLDGERTVGLDTGCVYGGSLTAYDVRREVFVSVPADEHVNRDEEKIVATGGR
ncbi:metallophosphoesterase family protein [Natronorubrum tibetense]|uniref:Metallophosphoesterase n=1 Tax=Natronorubrum tibetense GA33 TaxID=1114856 RepID=L9VXP6_9EURY|nr:metallophosphoesterase family protein [Natronorubrum tibetense]ELY41791.1 metallophosphoesterase [Natronorubrum tibetense GA33]